MGLKVIMQNNSGCKPTGNSRFNMLIKNIKKHKSLIIMFIPGFAAFALFRYGAMPGITIAFKDYIIQDGIWGSSWVGFENFRRFFSTGTALKAIRNSITISLLKLVFGFPIPIILAVLINEINNIKYKKVVQTVSYLPHFLSWVIIGGMLDAILSPSSGVVNQVLKILTGNTIYFLTDTRYWRVVLVIGHIWQSAGWGSIVYLAAISGINLQMYEAAIIDGATRLKRIRYITIPMILPLATILLILRMGHILDADFDEVFNLYNPMVYEVADIIDTYVYRIGIRGMQYSYTTAVGFFKSVVGFVMLITVNWVTRNVSRSQFGLW